MREGPVGRGQACAGRATGSARGRVERTAGSPSAPRVRAIARTPRPLRRSGLRARARWRGPVCERLPPDAVRPGLRGGDCRAGQRLRLLELASVGEQERLGGGGHHANAGTRWRDGSGLFEESFGLVEARGSRHRGEHSEAERLAREAVARVAREESDNLPWQGDAWCELAEVLEAAGRRDDAIDAWREALTATSARGYPTRPARRRKTRSASTDASLRTPNAVPDACACPSPVETATYPRDQTPRGGDSGLRQRAGMFPDDVAPLRTGQ